MKIVQKNIKYPFGNIATKFLVREDQAAYAGKKIDTPRLAYDYWNEAIATDPTYNESQERLVVIMLNTRHEVIGHHTVSIGSVNESIADPRDVLRPCVLCNAYAAILEHGHPSGNPSPSDTDRVMTKRMKECFDLFRIRLLDHVVIGKESPERFFPYYSFKEEGLL